MLFRAFLEFCIYEPETANQPGNEGDGVSAQAGGSWKRSEHDVSGRGRQSEHSQHDSESEPLVQPTIHACDAEHLARKLKKLDPSGVGAPLALVQLVLRLLQWHPDRRITAAVALQHTYFRGPFVCDVCGSSFEFESQLATHRHIHDRED